MRRRRSGRRTRLLRHRSAARVEEVRQAYTAALTWLRAVTWSRPAPRAVFTGLKAAAARLESGEDTGDPGRVLIQFAVAALTGNDTSGTAEPADGSAAMSGEELASVMSDGTNDDRPTTADTREPAPRVRYCERRSRTASSRRPRPAGQSRYPTCCPASPTWPTGSSRRGEKRTYGEACPIRPTMTSKGNEQALQDWEAAFIAESVVDRPRPPYLPNDLVAALDHAPLATVEAFLTELKTHAGQDIPAAELWARWERTTSA